MDNNYQKILYEICHERNIKITTVSNNWVNILEKDGKRQYVVGSIFDNINPVATSKILDDKYALYDVLTHFNIPIIKHHLLYKDYDKKEVENLFNKYHSDVVIKANQGYGGKDVFHITSKKELFSQMDKLFTKNYSISLCPYYDILKEYRLIVLDKEILLMYYKIKPEVIGDGQKTINELLKEFNPSYFHDIDVSDKVLASGEKYSYNWQFNLSSGANSCLDIEPSKKVILKNMMEEILKILPVRFCSIDIIETDGDFKVLEINSSVSVSKFMLQHVDGYEIAKNIYAKVIDLLFEN